MKLLTLFASVVFLGGVLVGILLSAPGFDVLQPYTWSTAPEQKSPSNWIPEDRIRVYNDRVVIYVDDPYWAQFANTNSMDPLLDEDTNAIQIRPTTQSQIRAGDVISYQSSLGPVIHRVIDVGADFDGWYAIVKGDNNPRPDPEKVRFNQVDRILVAVIY